MATDLKPDRDILLRHSDAGLSEPRGLPCEPCSLGLAEPVRDVEALEEEGDLPLIRLEPPGLETGAAARST